jgi:hypothetical protein
MKGAEIMLTNKERAALLGPIVDRARAHLNDGKPLTEMRRKVGDNSCDCSLHQLSQQERTVRIDAAIDATNANFGLTHPPLRSLTEAAEDVFNAAWSESPPSMRDYVERDVAQFFYLLGQRDGLATAAETLNGDLREIGRLAKERL